MTERLITGTLKLDGDNLLSFHYFRKGWHRKPLFRLTPDGKVLALDPGTKKEVDVGWAFQPLDNLVVVALRHV